jgi:hypothetical protein
VALTVDTLVDLVRDDIDEDNVVDISPADILQKLNRAQRKGVIKIIRNYDSMFLTSRDVTTTGVSDYAWASNVYAGKIKKLELILSNGRASEIRRLHFRQSTPHVRSQTTSRPTKYELLGKKWRLYGTPVSGLTIREWYVRTPETLVLSQGRILSSGTDATTSQPYIVLDAIGSDLTTALTDLNCFVNFINPDTGAVAGSAQIASIDTTNKRVLFKASGLSRSTVLGKTISTSLPSDLAADWYLATIHGTCVPEIPEAYTDYLTQHAVVSIKRAKGEPTKEDYAALKEEEEDIEQIYQGTETRLRVAQRNPHFQRRV